MVELVPTMTSSFVEADGQDVDTRHKGEHGGDRHRPLPLVNCRDSAFMA